MWLDVTRPAAELQRRIVESGLSRFPAAEGSLDRFVGVVDVRDVLAACFANAPVDVRAAVREAVVFPENTSALEILHAFQSRKTEIGIVVDEYGGFEGIITVADLGRDHGDFRHGENAVRDDEQKDQNDFECDPLWTSVFLWRQESRRSEPLLLLLHCLDVLIVTGRPERGRKLRL